MKPGADINCRLKIKTKIFRLQDLSTPRYWGKEITLPSKNYPPFRNQPLLL